MNEEYPSGAVRASASLASGTVLSLTPDRVLAFSCESGVQDGHLLGAVLCASASLTLHDTDGALTGYSFLDAVIGVSVRADGAWQSVLTFAVTRCTRQGHTVLLQGDDGVATLLGAAFEDDYDYPLTLGQLAAAIAYRGGLALSDDFPGSQGVISARPRWGSVSLRQALGYTAQAAGCFARMTGSVFAFHPVVSTPAQTLPDAVTLRRTAGEPCFGPVTGIYITDGESAPAPYPPTAPAYSSAYGVLISANPLIPNASSPLLPALYARLSLMSLSPLSVTVSGLGLPPGASVRAGQTVTVITRRSITVRQGLTSQLECTVSPAPATAGRALTAGSRVRASALTGTLDGGLLRADSVQASAIRTGSLTAQQLAAGSVTAEKLAAGSVTAQKLSAACVSADNLAASSVTADKLAAAAVTADKLAAQSVTAAKLAAGSVTAGKIAARSVTADRLVSGAITADSGVIAASAIGTAQIADGSITDAKIVGLTANKITAGTINGRVVNVNDLNADNITTGTLNGQRLPTLGTDKLQDGAVTGAKMADSAVTADKLAAGSVTAGKIAAQAVTANEILSGTITAAQLAAGTVTGDKIAAHTLTAAHLRADVGSSLDISSNASVELVASTLAGSAANLIPASEDFTLSAGTQAYCYALLAPVEAGVTYTFSVDSSSSRPASVSTYFLLVYNDTIPEGILSYDMPVSASRQSWSFTVPADKHGFSLYLYVGVPGQAAGVTQSWHHLKLARGALVTDWTPAPSDPAKGVETSSVSVRSSGIDIRTGGTLAMSAGAVRLDAADGTLSRITLGQSGETQTFSIDEAGNLSAQHGSFQSLTVGSGSVLVRGVNLLICSTRPSGVHDVLWLEPLSGVQAKEFAFAPPRTNSLAWNTSGASQLTKHLTLNAAAAGDVISAPGPVTCRLVIPYAHTAGANQTRTLTGTLTNLSSGVSASIPPTAVSFQLTEESAAECAFTVNANIASAPGDIQADLTLDAGLVGVIYIKSQSGAKVRLLITAPGGAQSDSTCTVHYIP